MISSDPSPTTFLPFSTCSAADFDRPEFLNYCRALDIGFGYERKLWEWVFILHHAFTRGVVGPNCRGLGFGVGTERLPAVFARAGTRIAATDAPPEIGLTAGWNAGDQHSQGLEMLPRLRMTEEEFESLVSFQACDMNNVDPNLTGFDFCWSSCALEHLGSLRAGMDFIIRSIETLRPGGIAIHTTEYNVESDDETLDNNWTVLYRRMDMNVLQAELTALGHTMEPFTVAPVLGPMDVHVDMPPYLHNPHLKLLLEGHVTTSCGIIVRRGS